MQPIRTYILGPSIIFPTFTTTYSILKALILQNERFFNFTCLILLIILLFIFVYLYRKNSWNNEFLVYTVSVILLVSAFQLQRCYEAKQGILLKESVFSLRESMFSSSRSAHISQTNNIENRESGGYLKTFEDFKTNLNVNLERKMALDLETQKVFIDQKVKRNQLNDLINKLEGNWSTFIKDTSNIKKELEALDVNIDLYDLEFQQFIKNTQSKFQILDNPHSSAILVSSGNRPSPKKEDIEKKVRGNGRNGLVGEFINLLIILFSMQVCVCLVFFLAEKEQYSLLARHLLFILSAVELAIVPLVMVYSTYSDKICLSHDLNSCKSDYTYKLEDVLDILHSFRNTDINKDRRIVVPRSAVSARSGNSTTDTSISDTPITDTRNNTSSINKAGTDTSNIGGTDTSIQKNSIQHSDSTKIDPDIQNTRNEKGRIEKNSIQNSRVEKNRIENTRNEKGRNETPLKTWISNLSFPTFENLKQLNQLTEYFGEHFSDLFGLSSALPTIVLNKSSTNTNINKSDPEISNSKGEERNPEQLEYVKSQFNMHRDHVKKTLGLLKESVQKEIEDLSYGKKILFDTMLERIKYVEPDFDELFNNNNKNIEMNNINNNKINKEVFFNTLESIKAQISSITLISNNKDPLLLNSLIEYSKLDEFFRDSLDSLKMYIAGSNLVRRKEFVKESEKCSRSVQLVCRGSDRLDEVFYEMLGFGFVFSGLLCV